MENNYFQKNLQKRPLNKKRDKISNHDIKIALSYEKACKEF